MFFISFCAAAPHRSTDQRAMEHLIDNLHQNFRSNFEADGHFTDTCAWPGVLCDSSGNVTSVAFAGMDWLEGTISLDDLPPHVRWLDLSNRDHTLSGTLDCSRLPRGLQVIFLSNNTFERSLNLTVLPPCLLELHLGHNAFEGELDFTALPEDLTHLDLSSNNFRGPVCFTRLPPKLRFLHLNENRFDGSVDLRRLPASLRIMDISVNGFGGALDVDELPATLESLNVSCNAFTELKTVTHLPQQLKILDLSRNQMEQEPQVKNAVPLNLNGVNFYYAEESSVFSQEDLAGISVVDVGDSEPGEENIGGSHLFAEENLAWAVSWVEWVRRQFYPAVRFAMAVFAFLLPLFL